jgi:hypothetical protein
VAVSAYALMMMAPSGDMIVKSMMIVNWTDASSATRIDW